MKKAFRVASLVALLAAGFALGANQSLNVFATSYPQFGHKQPATPPIPTPAPRPGPMEPEPFPCLPQCPGQ